MKRLQDTQTANESRKRTYTPEQLEAARAKAADKLSNCRPGCRICNGSGFVSSDAPVGSPDFGRIKPCPNRFMTAMRNGATRYGLIADEVEQLTWDMILPDINTAGDVIPRVKSMIDANGLVFLYGSNGLAKSLILKIAVAECLRNGKQAVYCNMVDLISNIRAAFDTNKPSSEAEMRLDFWQSVPVLAIDEFNRLNETPWVVEQRFSLLDARYNQAIRQKSFTIIASNTPPESQEDYLRSRLRDGRFLCIEIKGKDARPLMREGNHF